MIDALNAFVAHLQPPVPWATFAEEEDQDWSTASRLAENLTPIADVRAYRTEDVPSAERALDGVPRTVLFAWFPVSAAAQTLLVPVHRARLRAGVLARREREWVPHTLVETDVYLFPAHLVAVATGSQLDWLSLEHRLVAQGPIYDRLRQSGFLWTDPLRTLEGDHDVRADETGRPLQAEDLLRTGWLRQKAYDRVRELLRVLELGLLTEVHKSDPECVTLLDGPLAPLFKYAGLVSAELREWARQPSAPAARRFFAHIVGNVKNTVFTPRLRALDTLRDPRTQSVPVYRFPEVVEDRDDGLAREVGRVYLRLRPELPAPPIAVRGLSAIDVFLGPPEAPRPLEEAERLVASAFRERWPLPATSGHRQYTELLAIAETERWLRAGLPPIQELQLGTS